MSRTNSNKYEMLNLIFNNVAVANIGDASGIGASATVGNFYIAAYTVLPTKDTSGTEASYTGYARVALSRAAGTLLVENIDPPQVSNVSDITFPTSTSAASNILGWGICYEIAGNAKRWATLLSPIPVLNGTIPRIQAGQMVIK